MRVVFFGTPTLAATILEDLLRRSLSLVAVVSRPDKPKGRSSRPQPSPVKVVAEREGLPLYQPVKASSSESEAWLRSYNPDLFVVVAYAEILKQNILDIPKYGALNVHGSLLPKYRGAAPVQRALMAGEPETGLSIMKLALEMDAGDVYKRVVLPLTGEENAGEVLERMAKVGGDALWEVIEGIEKGGLVPTPQVHSQATFAPKVKAEEIVWSEQATTLHNLIRGLTPHPGVWCWVEVRGIKKRLHIKKAHPLPDRSGKPGTRLAEPSRLIVACGEGALELLEVQLEGKQALPTPLFLRGIDLSQFRFIQEG